jgi:hypothetical protein
MTHIALRDGGALLATGPSPSWPPPAPVGALCAAAVLVALAHGMLGCDAKAADALARPAKLDEAIPDVPVPSAEGPWLHALSDRTLILERPAAAARVIGELRPGARVARSQEPYSREGCAGGWYVVRPRGFVCAGDAATVEGGIAAALPRTPDLSRALPYRYGRARTEGVATYLRLPSVAEQVAAEPDLARHRTRTAADTDLLGASANDVPLDPRGVASGPPILLPTGEGVDPTSGRRTPASFFAFGGPELPVLRAAGEGILGAPIRKGSGVAITTSVLADGGDAPRRFGVMPDGRLVPADRLRPALGTGWHGLDLGEVGLPIAFVHKRSATTWNVARGKATANEESELERRTAIPLSGKFRTVEGQRFEQSREGAWLRADDVVVVVKRSKLPEFAKGTQKWLDVSIANQTLTAYEGAKPVYVTLISSGRAMLGDPAASASTVRGTFKVRAKHVSRGVDPLEVSSSFDVADAPWVLEFEPGYAITGNYWIDAFGEAQGHHDVSLAPIDARRIFGWADPELPTGWHSVQDVAGTGTIVHVRP